MRENKNDPRAADEIDAARLICAVAREKSRDAFAALFEFYAPRIKGWLMRRGATADAAEESAQDAMLAVWRKASYFDADRATASAWIFTIARNSRIDRLRRESRDNAVTIHDLGEPDAPETPENALHADESRRRVKAALAELSPDQMQVVQLSFFEGRAHGDIAQALNIPLGTVKSRLRLAMNKLRGPLDDMK